MAAHMTFKTNLWPNSDLGYSLGDSSLRWNIYGNLTGNASSATKLNFEVLGNIGYASNDTHYLKLGYFDATTSYDNIVLLFTCAFWGNQHGSTNIISIQQDRNDNSDSKPIKCTCNNLYLNGTDRKFYYKIDDTNHRLYLYVYVTGGNSYGKWNTSIIQSNVIWHQEYATNQSNSGLIEISKTLIGNLSGNASSASSISVSGGSTAKFWRGDNTWSDTISGGTFKITNNSNTITIGSSDSSWCHFENSANIPFYFNHQINAVDGFKVYNTTTSLTNNNLTFAQGGGWLMSDTTWIRTVGGKSVYQNTGILRTDGTLQVGSNGDYAQFNSSGIKLGSTTAASNGANLITINGHVVINTAKNTSNSFSEGIRINNGSNNWTTLTLGGDDSTTSGTSKSTWSLHTYRDDTTNKVSQFYLSYNGSNTATTRITGHANNDGGYGFSIWPRLGIGNNPDTNYALKVQGKSLITGPLYIGNTDTTTANGYSTNDSGSSNYLAFYGVYGDNAGGFNHTYIGESIYGSKTTANEQSELLLFHGNDPGTGSGPDRIRLFAGQVDIQVYSSALSGTWDTIRSTGGIQVANFSNGQVKITGNVVPEANNTRTLGTNDLKWSNVYATTFNGSLNGNVAWGNVTGKPSTSIAWTNGTTAGPTLTVTAAGSSSSAVAIPTASETASGIITTGGQNFTGRKGFGYMSRYGKNNDGTAVQWTGDTWLYNAAGTQVGEVWYDMGNATNITKGQYYWRQYSPNSTANTSTTGYYETYTLPAVALGMTSNTAYSILTTKNSYGPSSIPTLSWGAESTVLTLNGTAIKIKMPANPNTNTTNTAGSTDTSSKIFLIGATSQAASPQTYSDNEVYATNGQLDARCVRVASHVTMQYNTTTNALDFIFA